MSSIFVQIASYRDLELYPTLKDLYAKSSGENKITVGLVWQKDETESIGEFSNDNNVRIISVPWNESKGLGWARSLTQSLYQDEDYTLQLDSHHRFSQNWDSDLIDMLKGLQDVSPKPLLTAYAAGYEPNNDKTLHSNPCKILPHDFKQSGTIWFNPVTIPNAHLLSGPINARLVSGHYFFTLGQHCKEYIYDPDLYFAGDEIALSVRSYTLGYDLYHPHKCFVWHHYGRNDRIKHWSDHGNNQKNSGLIEKTWMERDDFSKKRIRQMLGEENNGLDLGIYGLGNVRTLEEYEIYAGFDFKNKRIINSAIEGVDPPVTFDPSIAFRKSTPIRIPSSPMIEYAKYGKNLDHVMVVYFSLSQEIIHKEIFHNGDVQNMIHQPYQSVVVADHYPMRVIFTAIGLSGNPINKWERDLRPNIHWN